MKTITTISIVLSLMLATGSAFGQSGTKQITKQSLFWFRYYNQIILAKGWKMDTELEDRRYAFPDRQHHWLIPRITLVKKLDQGWDAGAGFGYFIQSLPHDPDVRIEINVPEFRPHQDLIYKQSFKKWSIQHRYRLEERLIRKNNGLELQDGYNFNFRMRYRMQISIPVLIKEGVKGSLVVKPFNEIFFNMGSHIVRNIFDHNRLGIGLQYGITDHIQAQIDFFNWFQQRSDGDRFYSRNIFRFTLYQQIHLEK